MYRSRILFSSRNTLACVKQKHLQPPSQPNCNTARARLSNRQDFCLHCDEFKLHHTRAVPEARVSRHLYNRTKLSKGKRAASYQLEEIVGLAVVKPDCQVLVDCNAPDLGRDVSVVLRLRSSAVAGSPRHGERRSNLITWQQIGCRNTENRRAAIKVSTDIARSSALSQRGGELPGHGTAL